MEKLKPCPFCGGNAVRMRLMDHVDPRTGRGVRYFGCLKCCVVTFTNMTEAEAVEAWNRRDGENDAE